MVFEPDYSSNNPFDGDYVSSKNKEIIAISSIKHIRINTIITDVKLCNSNVEYNYYILTVVESYEEIKQLIEKAQ